MLNLHIHRCVAFAMLGQVLLWNPSPGFGAERDEVKAYRKQTKAYSRPAAGIAGFGLCYSPTEGCPSFEVRDDDRYVTVEVEDQLGRPVFASVGQDVLGGYRSFSNSGFPLQGSGTTHVCGRTEERIELLPKSAHRPRRIVVFLWLGPGSTAPAEPDPDALCPGIATAGVVTVTFFKDQ